MGKPEENTGKPGKDGKTRVLAKTVETAGRLPQICGVGIPTAAPAAI